MLYDARASRPFDANRFLATACRNVDFLRQFTPSKNAQILDVGCGRGFHLAELFRRGYRRLTGIDLSDKSIEAARRFVSNSCPGRPITLVTCDIRDFRSCEPFAVVYSFLSSFGSFGMSGDKSFLESGRRLLRPDGRFVLQLHNPANLRTLLGKHSIEYLEGSGITTITNVEEDLKSREITISQKDILPTGEERILPVERLRLYFPDELGEMLKGARLTPFEFYGSCESASPELYNSDSPNIVVVAG